MQAACCPSPVSAPVVMVLPTHRPLLQRIWLDLQGWRQSWRAHAELRRQLRALEGLSDSTLRDIGLAERLPVQRPGLSLMDLERGRW